MIDKLTLKRFTVFEDATVDFSPKINVIVGENGTGKTHLLKAAYTLSVWNRGISASDSSTAETFGKIFTEKLLRVFFPTERSLSELVKHKSKGKAELIVRFGEGRQDVYSFGRRTKAVSMKSSSKTPKELPAPVSFPAKEVLSFLPGMKSASADHNTIELLFDDSYLDLCEQLVHPAADIELDDNPRVGTLIPRICNAIGGEFRISDGRLRFRPGKYVEKKTGRIEPAKEESDNEDVDEGTPVLPQLGDDIDTIFKASGDGEKPGHTTAEGFKKVGVLQQLLANGSISPGLTGTLFWDEPEANVNPTLMRLLVQVMLEMARNGQQIVLATHDYVLLKWFDLLADATEGDEVRFHALYRDDESNQVEVETCKEYRLLNENAISDSFAELYDEEVRRAVGGGN